MFVSIPPHLALSTVMQRIKGRSSRSTAKPKGLIMAQIG